ncbi:hypothetical protein D3C79_775260 [compost metagenome]
MRSCLRQGIAPPLTTMPAFFPGVPSTVIGNRIAVNKRIHPTRPQHRQVIGEGVLDRCQKGCTGIDLHRLFKTRTGHRHSCLVHQPNAGRLIRIDLHHPELLQNRQHIGDVANPIFPRRQQTRGQAQRAGLLGRIGGGNLTGIASVMAMCEQIAQSCFKGHSGKHHLGFRRLAGANYNTIGRHLADLKR